MINLTAILAGTEKVSVEAKLAARGLPNSVWETYSAFSNTYGGVILLGVEEVKPTHQLIPKGIADSHQMIADIWTILNNRQKISANTLINENVYSIEYDGMDIVVIEVPRANRRSRPVFINNDLFLGSYKRNNEGDYHCTEDEVYEMVRDRSLETVDCKVIDNLPLSVLNRESIQSYRIIFGTRKPGHVWTKISDTEFLMRIGAAEKGEDHNVHPTLAGLLFFGINLYITDIMPNFRLDYRERFSTESRWTDRVFSGDGDWSGNIFDFYFKIIDRMTSDVKKPFKLDSKLLRVDDTPVHASLREALANALIHADYYGLGGVCIEKEFHKITISNPGSFRIDIDAAIAGGMSDARNSRIFNMFTLINVGERAGTGLCELYSTWKEFGYKTPLLVEKNNPNRVVLTLELEFDDGRNAANRHSNRHTDDNHNSNEKGILVALTERESEILAILRRDSSATASMIAEETGLSISTVKRTLKNLKTKSYITRDSDKWIVFDSSKVASDTDLTKSELKVLQVIRANNNAIISQVSKETGLSSSTVSRAYKGLKDKGYIARESINPVKWIVLR